MPHETSSTPYHYEQSPSHATPREAYEQNHSDILTLMGRINARVTTQYRTDQPREWEHIGKQEELLAMLYDMADFWVHSIWVSSLAAARNGRPG